MLTEIAKKSPDDKEFYECVNCQLITRNKKDFKKHLLTKKHQKNQELTHLGQKMVYLSPEHICSACKKSYKSRVGLWKHNKICIPIVEEPVENTNNNEFKMLSELFKMQMNENKELKELIVEQNKHMIELSKDRNTIIHNTTHNNTNNFNLQFFLNEQCKDALNIMDFVHTIKLQLSDLELVGRLGYTEGISKIFIRGLKELDIFKRPIHCSDLKRETLYVKDKDAWEKGNGENPTIKQAINCIVNRNIKQIPQWREENPTAEDTETKKHMDYIHILHESMGGSSQESDEKKHNRIVRNVAKEVVIDKMK
uniref:C2H2-type domain-containing protein n=1 Tax=viral metagenome TaxID=1070528 RepID=A0A6C0AYW0_9ZZZZ